jgi:hypothetical protein
MPMSIGCKTEVALGGKNTSFIFDKSWIWGCAGQLSTRSKIFLLFRLNSLFHLLTYCWKISEVTHAFFISCIFNGKLLYVFETTWCLWFSSNKESFLSVPVMLTLIKPVNRFLRHFSSNTFFTFEFKRWIGRHVIKHSSSVCIVDVFFTVTLLTLHPNTFHPFTCCFWIY